MDNLVSHAKVRFRQRGIQKDAVRTLMRHGEICPAPGGAHRITLSAREASKVINHLKKQIH